MGVIKSPIFIERKNDIPLNYLGKFNSDDLREDIEKYIAADELLLKALKEFSALAEVKIKSLDNDVERKKLINFKRDTYNLRKRFINQIDKLYGVLEKTDLIEVVLKIKDYYEDKSYLKEKIENMFKSKEEQERQDVLKIFLEEESLMNSLKFIQPSIVDKGRRYFAGMVKKPGVEERKLDNTLIKILTRGAYKTSPFSTLTKVGAGLFVDKKTIGREKEQSVRATEISGAYVLRIYEKMLLFPEIFKKLKFTLNESCTVLRGEYYWTTLMDQPEKRKKSFRTTDTLMKIKSNRLIEGLHLKFTEKEILTYEEMESVLIAEGVSRDNAFKYLQKFFKNNLILGLEQLEEVRVDILGALLHQLDKFDVKENDEINSIYSLIEKIRDKLKYFDSLENEESFNEFKEVESLFEKVTEILGLPKVDSRYLLYQDYLNTSICKEEKRDWLEFDESLVLYGELI